MPNADEAQAERETFGNAPGWSQNQREDAGAAGASPTPDAVAAPSADVVEAPSQEQVTEQAPPPTSQPEPEKTFNMPPPERWEELRKQREDAERRAQQAEQLAQLALQKLQTPQVTVQPDVDPYAGMDAATAEFYRNMDKRIEVKATQLAEQKLQGVLQAVDAGRRELAEIKISQFRKDNPDIKLGSQEEALIAGYVQSGYDLQSAKKLALYDKLEAENRAFKTKQSTVPQRVAAARTESSSGIPAASGLPPKQGDWRERVGSILDKGGNVRDAAKALFG